MTAAVELKPTVVRIGHKTHVYDVVQRGTSAEWKSQFVVREVTVSVRVPERGFRITETKVPCPWCRTPLPIWASSKQRIQSGRIAFIVFSVAVMLTTYLYGGLPFTIALIALPLPTLWVIWKAFRHPFAVLETIPWHIGDPEHTVGFPTRRYVELRP